MIKILVISVIAIFFFSGCGSPIQTETILVPKPYPVCNELEIYKVEDQEFKNRVKTIYPYMEGWHHRYSEFKEIY